VERLSAPKAAKSENHEQHATNGGTTVASAPPPRTAAPKASTGEALGAIAQAILNASASRSTSQQHGAHASGAAAAAAGLWQGTFTCGQRVLGLQLNVVTQPDGTLAGRLDYGGVGAFTVRGHVANGHVMLNAERWIVQPPGDGGFNVQGQITPDQRMIHGTVVHPQCGAMMLTRASH
jgi:hypothetical protein